VNWVKINPDETNKKVSLGTRGPDGGFYASLRLAKIGNHRAKKGNMD